MNKASGDRIPDELFQILKDDDALKCCTQYASKLGKHRSGHRTGKRSVFIPIPKKGSTKEWSNYRKIALISHASKVLATQCCLTLCDPMDCSLLGSSVHGTLQARILDWVAIPLSRGSFQPRNRTCVSCISCIAGSFFTYGAT